MFLVGLSSSFIPYLLLSLATLICYMHDHQAASDEAETTISASLTETSETFALSEAHDQSPHAIEQVQACQPRALIKEISAIIVSYTGHPISIIASHHPLRAPPGISIIHS